MARNQDFLRARGHLVPLVGFPPPLAGVPQNGSFSHQKHTLKSGCQKRGPAAPQWSPRVPTWSPKASKIITKCVQKLVPKAHWQKTPLCKHSNYENMTPVQAGALFSLWRPTCKKSQNRSRMDAQTDPKSHKPSPGHHFQVTVCTACVKIFKKDLQKDPQNESKIY